MVNIFRIRMSRQPNNRKYNVRFSRTINNSLQSNLTAITPSKPISKATKLLPLPAALKFMSKTIC